MVSSLNKVTLLGNLGRDPEIRSTQDGKEIANFSIATSEAWKDKMTGERREKTEWHRVVVFSQPLINIIKSYVKKGTKLYVEGSLQTRKWTDQSGVEKYTTEIVLQNFNSVLLILDSRNNNSSHESAESAESSASPSFSPASSSASAAGGAAAIEKLDDEIPF